jgi:DNA-binding NtrC family response regulator
VASGVLIIEDEPRLANNIQAFLRKSGFDAYKAETGFDGLGAFERCKPDIVLLDLNLPDVGGLEVLKRLRSVDPKVKVIMMTGAGSTEAAVAAMKAGAWDWLTKPLGLKELKVQLEKLAGQERLEGTLDYYQTKEAGKSGLDKLLGESPVMRALKQKISQIVETEAALKDGPPPSVLVTGQTGTGKELAARAIHFEGARRHGPFIEINCAAIPANLLEAELFGYEKGAFTDARQRKLGLVEAADGGTLFLDEIGEIDAAVQSKLLKLLEDRTVRRLGGLRDATMDVRILAATNRDLERLVREGGFRSDLYFRLTILQLEMPRLCERGADIVLLAEHFLTFHCNRYGKQKMDLNAAAKEALLRYPWPGNVRELRNGIEQTVLLARDPVIGPGQIPLRPNICHPAPPAVPPVGPDAFALPEEGLDLEALERRLMVQALEKSGGNVTKAAKLLGLSRDTLRYRMEKFSLKAAS